LSGEIVSYETWFSLPDGRRIFEEICYYPVFDTRGETVLGAAVLSRDHTARKEAEEALRKSKAGYQAVFEQAAAGIGSAGPDGKILDVNKALCDMLGYSREELLRATVSEITWPEDVAVENELIQEVIEGKRDAFHLEKRLLHKNGHPIWVHHSSNVVRLGKEEEPFAIGVSVDITARKEAEEALKKTRDFLDQTGRMARVGGWELNADIMEVTWTEETFRIHEIYRETEPPLEEAIRFFHPEDRPMLRAAIECGLRHGIPYDLELRFVTAKGNELWVRTLARPILDGERVSKLVGTFQDITDRKTTEEALRKQRDMLAQAERLADIGSWEWEVAADKTTWSKQLHRITGIPSDRGAPKWAEQRRLYPPEDWERLSRAVESAINEGKSYELEIQVIREDGEIRHCIAYGFPETGLDGHAKRLFGSLQDITKRKEAEEKLKRSQERFRIILENMGEEVYVHDLQGRFLLVNRAARENTGYPGGQLLQMNVADIAENLPLASEARNFWSDIPLHAPVRLEAEHRRADGSHYLADLTLTHISMHDEPAILVLARDITDRKQAEQALREREAMHRIISELATDYFYRVKIEASGTISIDWVSESFERVTSYAPDELNQFETWLSKIHPEDLENLEKNTEYLLANRPVWSHYRFATRNGETRWLADRLHPEWSAEENRVVGAYGAVRDITERKKSEEALAESGARFRAIFEQAAAGIATATAEGMFLEANRTLCDMLGYTAEELGGLSVYDLTFPDDREKQVNEEQPVRDGKSDTIRLEKRFLHKNGHPVWANLASNVVRDEAGNIQYVIGVVVDIDQRKRMEAALLEALEEKEILLREIHHRTKNNMQSILSLLRIHSRMEPGASFQSVFEDCRGRIEAMALIHEALYQSDDLVRIHFQTYLKKLCRNLARVHAGRINGVSVEVAPTEVSLNMDQGIAVGMVIAELISNAFKHGFPSGGRGTVAISLGQPEPGMVELTVSDNGAGLPPDLDIHRTESLGLKLVSGTVQRELGGTLELKRNGGATFIARFPCAQR
jgi:PAS domain S-box-containing protein